MQWTDRAIVLGARKFGEGSVIAEVLSEHHGRHKGLVRGGASPRQRGTLQPGNEVEVTWRARLEDHLGNFLVELQSPRAATLMADRPRLSALTALVAMASTALPEREACPGAFGATLAVLDLLAEEDAGIEEFAAALVRWEMGILSELGFGLDLDACAVTGETTGLRYISPKTGRAVTREGAGAYADKLLALPAFLTGGDVAGEADIRAGFRLTGFFLNRQVYEPNRMTVPDARARFIELLRKTDTTSGA